MRTKDDIREGVKGFFQIMRDYPTAARLSDIERMTDDEISGELTVLFFEMSDKLKKMSPELDWQTVHMVIQGQIESFCGCTYEEIFEYFLKDYDPGKVSHRVSNPIQKD